MMHPLDRKGTGVTPIQERYRPIAKLGSGGMADVFLGVQLGEQGFERLLVIKKIHARGLKNDSAIQMFIDEARVIASLNHPHIVKVYDLSRVRDQICITMEYIDGENLDYMLRALKSAKKIFPLPIVCKLMIEACEALHYAHSVKSPDGLPLNLVHRDIGAQNIMIDSQGYLKVIDFGIAKSTVQTEFTLPGLIKGKLSYLAPDVFKFKDIDGRVDLYALGLVLYELVTMQRPFSFSSETTMAEILNSILQDTIRSPTEINKAIPLELERIIYKATEKDRNLRYQTGEEFAGALYDFANKHDGIATTIEVKNWYQTEFKQRIEQRHRFEKQVQEKANRIKQKTTNSGIISLPPVLGSGEKQEEKQEVTPEKPLPIPPAAMVGAPKKANPYLLLVVAFILFIGGLIVVQQLFFYSNRGDREITLAPNAGQSPTSRHPGRPSIATVPDTKASTSTSATSGNAPTPPPAPTSLGSPAPPVSGAAQPAATSEDTIKSPPVSNRDATAGLGVKTMVVSKAAVEPIKTHTGAVVKKPAYQPPRRKASVRASDTGNDYYSAGLTSSEGDEPPASESSGFVNTPATPTPTAEKTVPESTVAMVEPPKMETPAAPVEKTPAVAASKQGGQVPAGSPTNETKRPVVVATVNLLSGNGNWTGEQVAQKGCTHCHTVDWNSKTKSQWQRFITRGLHNRHRDLKLYFSDGEISRFTTHLSTKEEEVQKPKGIAGAQ